MVICHEETDLGLHAPILTTTTQHKLAAPRRRYSSFIPTFIPPLLNLSHTYLHLLPTPSHGLPKT
jgi:hypothetical protein